MDRLDCLEDLETAPCNHETTRAAVSFDAMISSLLLTGMLCAAPDLAFAFSDASGTRLLALGPVADPAHFTRATCDGRVLDVVFLRQQPRGAKDSGRQVGANFDQVEGALYAVEGPAIARDASCLLATAAFFSARPPRAATAAEKTCDGKLTAAIAGLEKRAVERCLEVGGYPGGRLALVTFARSGKSLLVGFVLLTGETRAMRRFEATTDKDASSCWRVDDGCTFEAGAYRVPFVLTGAGGPLLFTVWDGPEGQNIDLLEAKDGALEVRATAYRYWAPL